MNRASKPSSLTDAPSRNAATYSPHGSTPPPGRHLADSLAFLREHHAALTSKETVEILAEADHDTTRQHLTILNLTSAMAIEQVYAIVTAAGTAEEAPRDALDAGDLPRLGAILPPDPTHFPGPDHSAATRAGRRRPN